MKRLFLMLAMTAAMGWAQQPATPAPAAVPARGVLAPPPAGYGAGARNILLADANIELTVYLVSGLAQPQPGAATDLPDDLAATLNQMRGVFAYKSYKLVNAFTLRGRNGSSSEMAGDLPLNNWTYDFKYGNANVYENAPGIVHINRLRLEIAKRSSVISRAATPGGTSATVPTFTPTANTVALVSTDLDVKEGQKTVVGQSAVNGTDALFLVIVPKVATQ